MNYSTRFEVGDYEQQTVFSKEDSGPFWLTNEERKTTKKQNANWTYFQKYYLKSELLLELRK